MRPLQIPREHCTAQSICRIVRHPQRLLLGLKAHHHDEGPEDLFAVNLHAVLDAGEYGRFNEEAFAVADVFVGVSACGEGGAFLLAGLDVGEDAVVLGFGDLRALEGGVREGVANLAGGFDCFLELSDEGVVNVLVD